MNMTLRGLEVLGVGILLQSVGWAQEAAVPGDDEIRAILVDRIDRGKQGVGMVVGIVDPKGRRVIAWGTLEKGDKRTLDGDTVFEIGSMTKVFTSLVLMDMAQRGEVSVTDPVAKYLPAGVKMPERNGKVITLQDLSTQSSGLPRLPSNLKPKDPANPYADYSVAQLYGFLSGYQLTRDPGEKYEYSNLGAGLLGHALALRARMDYEAMVRTRICDPLRMTNTRVTLTPEMNARLAPGHDASLSPVPNWDLPTLAGAGALRSTANDLLIFLAANLGYTKTALSAAMEREVSIRRPTGDPQMEIAYAWHVLTRDGKSVIWHNGGTGGYRTFMGYDPKSRVGVVVLSNTSTPAGPDDIGFHLLNAKFPLSKVEPPKEHTTVTLESKVLDGYPGFYELGPNTFVTVTRDGERMFVQLTGQPKLEVFASAEKEFFLKVVDAQITFETDARGKATRLVLHQNGRDSPAMRVDEARMKASTDAIAKRYQDQKPAPGSEAALRRHIEELRAGEPKYETMSPGLADAVRPQLAKSRELIVQMGTVESVTFKAVGPAGPDIYEVKCEHGTTEWRIWMGEDGKIASLNFRTSQ
jgi:serine-type D-Ala-D-Ala carboxypeptidase/endopeptidase